MSYAQLDTAARLRGALLGRDRPIHFGFLSLVVYIMGSGQVSDLLGGNKTLPPPQVSQPNGSTRGGVNTTPQGGSLPRRSQRPGRKNSQLESTAMCFHDPGYDVKLHPAVILYMS